MLFSWGGPIGFVQLKHEASETNLKIIEHSLSRRLGPDGARVGLLSPTTKISRHPRAYIGVPTVSTEGTVAMPVNQVVDDRRGNAAIVARRDGVISEKKRRAGQIPPLTGLITGRCSSVGIGNIKDRATRYYDHI
jgi:hypothetical protein